MALDKQEIKLMAGALAGVCLGNFIIFSAPIYIGSLMDGLGFDETQAGLINTLEISAVAIVCLLLSRWLERFSLRYLAIAGAVMLLLANLATFGLESFEALLLLRTLAGVGAGLCLAVTSALVSRMTDPDRAIGMMLGFNTVIMIVVLSLMGYAKSEWLFDGVVGLFSLVVILLFPVLFLIPGKVMNSNRAALQKPLGTDQHLFLGLLGLGVLYAFCTIEGGVWAFSERSAINLGVKDSDIGYLLSMAQGAGLLGAMIPSIFGGRIPRIIPVAIGTLSMGSAGLFIYSTTSTLVYSTFLCVFSFGFFLAFPYLVGACARLDAGGKWAARANGVNLLGGAVAPFIAANIISASDYQSLGKFCFGLSIICLCLALWFDRRFITYKYSQP